MNNCELNNTVICGDTLENVRGLPDASIDCVITSPPYWQLRDYGFPEQWGLEKTYQEYLEHLWSLMDEIYRVLKDTGTVWINLGDSYYGSGHGNWSKFDRGEIEKKDAYYGEGRNSSPITDWDYSKMQQKTLMLIPHRFAIGCIDRGWILRNDIIWAKRNGMPESVRDRFSKKHEFIFFMVKQQKYYFDLDGVRSPHKENSLERIKHGWKSEHDSIGSIDVKEMGDRFCNPSGKNPGDVSDFWDIPTQPSSEKHYATFNTDLIDKPIVAGCPEGGIILDPFCGTGTTLIRGLQLGRQVIGIDGKAEYCEIATKRITSELNQIKMEFNEK